MQVGVVHHRGNPIERGVRQAVLVDDAFERAATFLMPQLDPGHVERCAAKAKRFCRVGGEGESGVGVDETPDHPRAGGPVDLGTGPGDPEHRAPPCQGRAAGGLRRGCCYDTVVSLIQQYRITAD